MATEPEVLRNRGRGFAGGWQVRAEELVAPYGSKYAFAGTLEQIRAEAPAGDGEAAPRSPDVRARGDSARQCLTPDEACRQKKPQGSFQSRAIDVRRCGAIVTMFRVVTGTERAARMIVTAVQRGGQP